MKKKFGFLTLCLCMIFLLGINVFAHEADDSTVKVNDIIEGDNGEDVVISILDDGRFVTAPLGAETYAACQHTNIVGLGTKHQVTSSYNKENSTYCYKYRFYEDARCAQCGKTGYKIYDKTWTKVKHKYKLFGDTCTVCGYVK